MSFTLCWWLQLCETSSMTHSPLRQSEMTCERAHELGVPMWWVCCSSLRLRWDGVCPYVGWGCPWDGCIDVNAPVWGEDAHKMGVSFEMKRCVPLWGVKVPMWWVCIKLWIELLWCVVSCLVDSVESGLRWFSRWFSCGLSEIEISWVGHPCGWAQMDVSLVAKHYWMCEIPCYIVWE